MITKELAADMHLGEELHEGTCSHRVGPKGGVVKTIVKWRVNGHLQTWKTRPLAFMLPIKHGFYGPSAYVDERNGHLFHRAIDCPVSDWCRRCHAQLTHADWAVKHCTQCGKELDTK